MIVWLNPLGRLLAWIRGQGAAPLGPPNAPVTPLSFRDLQARQQAQFGDVDRSPCSCPQCRHARRQRAN